jgi:hypothetical protein
MPDVCHSPDLDPTDASLVEMMLRFEALAAALRATHLPELDTPDKRALLDRLASMRRDRDALAGGPLAGPVAALEAAAAGRDAADVLLVQGLLLEPLGRVIYRRLVEDGGALAALAEAAMRAGAAVLEKTPALVRARLGAGDAIYAAFVGRTAPVIAALDGLGQSVDAVFGERYGLRFADLIGELVTETLPLCVAVGMTRRMVLSHLTTTLMAREG